VQGYRAPELASNEPTGLLKARRIAQELLRARSGIAAYFAGALQLVTVSTILAWLPSFFNRGDQVQKAVDCYNAGATVLHVHCRETDGKGSKRLSVFNEMLDRLRTAVPKMVLQVGGSISFAPEGEGAEAKWLSDDTRHMLADLKPKPDQVTSLPRCQELLRS
jgi:hypothetical protein